MRGWTIRPGGRRVLLLTLRRWLRGVVRGFRRAGQFVDPGLKCRNPRVLGGNSRLGRCQLPKQRQDQRVLPGVAQFGKVGRYDHPVVRIDSPVTVSNEISHTPDRSTTLGGGRQPHGCRPQVSNYSASAGQDEKRHARTERLARSIVPGAERRLAPGSAAAAVRRLSPPLAAGCGRRGQPRRSRRWRQGACGG